MRYDATVPILIVGFILFLLAGGIFILPFIIILVLIVATIYIFFNDFIYIVDIFDRFKKDKGKYIGKHVSKERRGLHNEKDVYLGCGCAWVIGLLISIPLLKLIF